MLILVVALLGGLAAGLVLHGSLRNLEHFTLRLGWLALVALAVQIVIFSPIGNRLPSQVIVTMHLVSFALLLACVACNLRRAPVVVFGMGVLSNAVAIAVNGGYMPATRAALVLAGIPVSNEPHNNSLLADAGTRLGFLTDVMAVPHWIPLANVFSVGDLLVAVGLAWLLAEGMQPGDGASLPRCDPYEIASGE